MADYVIIGASLTGASAAIALREHNADASVTLIGAEDGAPYERPPLSKGYLRGSVPFEKLLVRPTEFYSAQRIETMFGSRVTGIDSSRRIVLVDDGRRRALRFAPDSHGRAKSSGAPPGNRPSRCPQPSRHPRGRSTARRDRGRAARR